MFALVIGLPPLFFFFFFRCLARLFELGLIARVSGAASRLFYSLNANLSDHVYCTRTATDSFRMAQPVLCAAVGPGSGCGGAPLWGRGRALSFPLHSGRCSAELPTDRCTRSFSVFKPPSIGGHGNFSASLACRALFRLHTCCVVELALLVGLAWTRCPVCALWLGHYATAALWRAPASGRPHRRLPTDCVVIVRRVVPSCSWWQWHRLYFQSLVQPHGN